MGLYILGFLLILCNIDCFNAKHSGFRPELGELRNEGIVTLCA